MENTFPLISLLFLTFPISTALLWGMRDASRVRWAALATTLVDLALCLAIVGGYQSEIAGFQWVETHPWIPSIGVHYRVGVDGISMWFLPLTALLFAGAVLASWNRVHTLIRLYYSLLLMLKTVTLGIFCALDTILFFFLWELTLIPIYFLVSLWGVGPHRRYAAVQYTLLMIASGIPLLMAFVLLAVEHSTHPTLAPLSGLVFSLPELLATPTSPAFQTLLFFLLLAGLAPKVPIVPFHVWLPTMAREGPVVVLAFMTGLKLGAYGMIRFLLPLAPKAAHDYHWLLAGLGTLGLLYGAFLALSQTNLLILLAYASISHVGLVLLGMTSMNLTGIQGAVFQLLNFTVISSGLYFMTGFLQHRTGSTEAINLGGLARTMPFFSACYLLFGLAGLGIPGTNGFPAEFLIFMSTLETHTGAGFAALAAVILGAGYFMNLFRKSFFGPVRHELHGNESDLNGRERTLALVLASLILLLGLAPNLLLDPMRVSAENWVGQLNAAQP
ncbi:MAG: NADH-quinone oxidoreductase subunit M [Magnetococcales bacterium]|nr:NADH-quinone oxidoreductase subunit M [Magnetococcales bacterium]MBF0148477.1 NADH-quinone oxidoreductase subunit M [Magnetococcales bacterium]MBF0172626.1 NADH-quinone oxidoreductase subunit M [Magnetococcales bacterium]MBF0347542.1 NADH-quinone oxidoreductase subunit M [Magnetococcales bacterium]MBF0629925.1 NADH-quinone oxidoreductase subunit M [Magnetococcales bacterium]